MREVIVREWRDDIGMIHQKEIGELIRCAECEWYNGDGEYCSNDHFAVADGYCNYGKRSYDKS